MEFGGKDHYTSPIEENFSASCMSLFFQPVQNAAFAMTMKYVEPLFFLPFQTRLTICRKPTCRPWCCPGMTIKSCRSLIPYCFCQNGRNGTWLTELPLKSFGRHSRRFGKGDAEGVITSKATPLCYHLQCEVVIRKQSFGTLDPRTTHGCARRGAGVPQKCF